MDGQTTSEPTWRERILTAPLLKAQQATMDRIKKIVTGFGALGTLALAVVLIPILGTIALGFSTLLAIGFFLMIAAMFGQYARAKNLGQVMFIGLTLKIWELQYGYQPGNAMRALLEQDRETVKQIEGEFKIIHAKLTATQEKIKTITTERETALERLEAAQQQGDATAIALESSRFTRRESVLNYLLSIEESLKADAAELRSIRDQANANIENAEDEIRMAMFTADIEIESNASAERMLQYYDQHKESQRKLRGPMDLLARRRGEALANRKALVESTTRHTRAISLDNEVNIAKAAKALAERRARQSNPAATVSPTAATSTTPPVSNDDAKQRAKALAEALQSTRKTL